jgi:hypothetical protein
MRGFIYYNPFEKSFEFSSELLRFYNKNNNNRKIKYWNNKNNINSENLIRNKDYATKLVQENSKNEFECLLFCIQNVQKI